MAQSSLTVNGLSTELLKLNGRYANAKSERDGLLEKTKLLEQRIADDVKDLALERNHVKDMHDHQTSLQMLAQLATKRAAAFENRLADITAQLEVAIQEHASKTTETKRLHLQLTIIVDVLDSLGSSLGASDSAPDSGATATVVFSTPLATSSSKPGRTSVVTRSRKRKSLPQRPSPSSVSKRSKNPGMLG